MSHIRIVIKGRGNWEQTVAAGDKARVTIGRAPENDIVLADLHTSAHHAMITRKNDAFMIRDLDSRNGTFVNSVRITEDTAIVHGDTIHIGISDMILRTDTDTSLNPAVSGISSPPVVASDAEDVASSIVKLERDELQRELREAKQQIRILKILTEFSAFLAGRASALEVVSAALHFMAKQINAENGFIMQIDPATSQWSVRARYGDILDWTASGSEKQELQLPMSLTVVEQVIRSGKPVVSLQTLEDPRFDAAKSIESLGILSCLCFPLVAKGTPVGVAYLDRRVNIEAFSRTEEKIFQALTEQLNKVLYA